MASRHGRRVADISGEFYPFHINAQVTVPTALGAPYDLGHGVYLQAAVINDQGSGGSPWVLTLYNGANIFAKIVTTTQVSLAYRCVCDQGVRYTYSGGTTAGSVTLRVLPVTV